jgi:DNA sulfur modification protein DndD
MRLVEELCESELAQKHGRNQRAGELVREYADREEKPDPAPRNGDAGPSGDGAYRIRRLRLFNYCVFADAELVFLWHPDRPICLVEGNNGYGKTKIIEAIRFALFGSEKKEGLVALLHRDAEKPKARLEVALELDTPTGEVVTVRRFVEYSVMLGQWKAERQTLVARVGEHPLQDDDAQEWVNARLPRHVMDCFVFDAENSLVDKLASGDTGASVAEQLERVLGVTLIRCVAGRVGDAVRALRSELDDAATKKSARQARASLEEVEAEQEKVENTIADEAGQVRRLHDDKTKLAEEQERLLRQFDPAAEGARAQRTSKKERLSHRQNELKGRLAESVGKTLPLQLLSEHIRYAVDAARAARTEEEAGAFQRGMDHAVRGVATLAVEGRIPWQQAPMPSVDEIRGRLADLLDMAADPESQDGYLLSSGTVADLEAVLLEAGRAPVPGNLVRELREIAVELSSMEVGTVEGPSGSVPSDLIERHRAISGQLNDLAHQIGRREDRLAGLRQKRDDLVARKEEKTQELDTARGDERKQGKLKRQWEFASRVADCMEQLAGCLRDLRVDDLERGATEMFRLTTNKPELYARVVFDRTTLRYHVNDHEGRPAPLDRSTGERMVLSLAVVHGLQQASGRRIPLIVEAPLKPLDPVHTDKVIRHAFQSTAGQTVLLLKPEEIPAYHKAAVAPRIGQRFVLERPDPGKEASVVKDRTE